MKSFSLISAVLFLCANASHAQEAVQELSKKARKGFMTEAVAGSDGYTITYKIPGDKKKDEIFYEAYRFDKAVKFLKSEDISAPKQTSDDKPDRVVNGIYASVGGCSSFDILSMKLKFSKSSLLQTWDYRKQRYVTQKTLTSETFKPKSDHGKYIGFASFNSVEDESLFVLAGTDSKSNKRGIDFYVMSVNMDGDVTEKPVDVGGSQSLVFSAQLRNGDVALVFAPKKDQPDISTYTYLLYSARGDLKQKSTFKSPSNNLLVVDAAEKNGSVFFCATSTKSKDAFEEVFEDYAATIANPCFTEGENKQDMKWLSKADDRMESFHLLKFTGDKLDFASTAAISDFKARFKTAPGDKGADPYKGRKLCVEEFTVTPDGEYLIAGQLNGKQKMGSSNTVKTYEDIVCLHFDKAGQLKAQYGVEKMNRDKKSEIFPVTQAFMPAKDGKSLYWVIMEVKGFKGYASFIDAYEGSATYHPRFFPRIAKLDAGATSLGSFAVLGDEQYYVSKSFRPLMNAADNSIVFIGSDEDYKKLWLSRYVFQ